MNGGTPALAAFLAWAPWGATPGAGMTMPLPAYAALLALGLCLGSFLNVVVYRLPRGRSIAWPPSACPACGHAIRPFDNVPVASWLVLGGRCRDCRAPISWRYPAVELGAGLVTVAIAAAVGPRASLLPAIAFGLGLLAVALIDLDFRIIPDELSLGGLAIGLFARGLTVDGLVTGLIGALVGGGALALVAWGYRRVTGVDGLGGGDVKLAGMIGAFLGWPGAFLTLLGAALAGSLVGGSLVLLGRAGRRTALPFGAFLAPAGLWAALLGPQVWRWYAGLCGLRAPGF